MCRQVTPDLERGRTNAHFWYSQSSYVIECKTFRCHLTKYFQFWKYCFHSIVHSNHAKDTCHSYWLKSVFHFLCFSHFSEGMCLQDKGHMVLLLLTNRRMRDGICPVALPSPNQLKIHSAKQTQNTAISGWKHNIGRCQQENLTLCQVSDTNLPEILKFNKANLPCSLDFGLRSYGFRSRFWQQTSLPNPTPTKLQRSYL